MTVGTAVRLAFMRDVLANSTERAENDEAHDTSMGTHNLSMTGDMPIAQPTMLALLAYLNTAIERGESRMELDRRAIDVAKYMGASRPISAVNCIVAACLFIMQPDSFKTVKAAAQACDCSMSNCYRWVKLLRDKIHDELANDTVGCSRVLANSTERAENDGAHDMSMGTHNLSMTGDMPIAQPTTKALLAYLNTAIERGDSRMELDRRAIDVAKCMGASRPITAVNCVIAACLLIMQPKRFKGAKAAAQACDCSMSNCHKWIKLLRDKIHDEQANDTVSCSRDTAPLAQAAQPTMEETLAEVDSLAEADTIASLILLGRRSPSFDLDLREAPPSSARPPSIPPSPPVMAPRLTSKPAPVVKIHHGQLSHVVPMTPSRGWRYFAMAD